jgi:1-acyl-sn-glycerol-3-phosphate acyltransferase
MNSSPLASKKPTALIAEPSFFRLIPRVLLFLSWTMLLASLQLFVRRIRPDLTSWLPMRWHRGCCRIFGLEVEISGCVTTQKPVLFVSNHVSYLDISLLGSILPGAFIAKADIEQWPLFGVLAKLQNTLFIERASRHVKGQLDQMQQHLQQQENLILFPEGTSSDGSAVLPFKSALFKSVEKGSPVPVWIQPVSLAYHTYDGQPMSPAIRDYYAWYNDMPAVSHMLKMAGMKRATISVILHPAISGEQFPNRKALAEYCQQQVTAGVLQGLTR